MISVVLPTYQEAKNLPLLIPQIHQVLQSFNYEIIVVDDDSQDGTEDYCSDLANEYPLRLISRRGERGLATAVLTGFDEAKGEYLVCMDADHSHPPELIPKMIKELKSNAEFVLASRYISGAQTHENWSFLRKLNSLIPTLLTRRLTSVKDPMSGFFCLYRHDYKKNRAAYSPLGYKIALELIVKLRLRVSEVPFTFADRLHGESKLNSKQRYLFLRHLIKLFIYQRSRA
jgi:dolichol-phosphate mannosyltransferase